MLTEEQMQQMDAEVKQRGMGINPDVMPVQDEADNYALTPEAAAPEEPMPQEYVAPANDNQEDDVFSGDAYITGPAKIKPNMAAKRLIEFTDQLADDVKKTNIYKRYAYSKEDVLREAREISIETGIPERAILYSPQTLDNARNVFNYRRRQMDLMPPGTNEVNIDLLTKAYPGLKDIVDNGSEVDAAIALQNIKNVRQVNGLVDAAKTRWQAGWMQHEIANVGRQALRQGRAITDEEFARADKITKQIEDLRETPSFVEDPLLSIVGGTAEQVPQQLRGIGTGALFGTAAAATAVTVGAAAAIPTGGLSMAAAGAAAKTAFGWGMRAGYAVDMWEDSAAQRYIEYSRFKDKDGKRVLTDEEARAYAAVAAAVETGIEFMNAGKIVDVLKGNKSAAARQIRDAVAGATDNATFAASLKRILSGMGEIAISESLEEGGQEASDRILSNVVASFKGGDIPKYTPGEILTGAVESFAASLPATIGFGLTAAGGGSIGLVRRAAAYAELNDLHVKERMKNLTGINMIQGMVQDAGIKEFFKKDTDIAKQVLHNTVEGTGYEKVNIDTQMVLDQEGGMNALQEIGKAAGMSADEIQRAVETKADITVPTETYFQMRAENENFAINENLISFSDTAPCFARNQYYANMIKSELDSLMQDMDARQVAQQQAALDMIVQRDFAAGLEQDAAASILAIRPDNPMAGWQEMRGMYKQRLDDILAPVIRELKGGMKQGVEIRRDESDRDTKYVRESQNADWARKFYAENKRWPTQFELEGMAIDILSGRDFSKLPDYQNRPEMQEFYDSNAEQINDLLQTIDVFDGIRDKIAAIDPDELQTMEGMSKEAYDIYRNVAQHLQASAPNDAVKRSAKAGAALLARRADRFAEAMRAAGNTNYTAADYFRDRFGLRVGGTFQGGGSNTLFQVSPEEFNRQKAEVRKQYEGTDRWMKAPGGEETNLTEDRWITVRTPAFKNWFGDWENDPQNASKVLDENGEPLVVYHGSDADFDIFDRTKARANMDIQGSFFSPWKEDAGGYGGNVRSFFLNIRKPANEGQGYKALNKYKGQNGAGVKAREDLTARGFDGVNNENEEYIAFEPNQIKDASGRNVGFDPGSNNIYLQMAGENALNAPLEKLQEAKKMEQDGADEADIWKQTGWIKGKDNRWRFEIQDNLRNINFSNLVENGNAMLPNVYGNSLLYAAYPQLANIPVVADKNIDGDKNGYYDPATGIIHVSDNLLKNNETRAKENLVHEIQHVIQGIERFAMGGSPETITRQLIIEFDNVEHEMRKISEDAFAYFNRKKDFELAQLYFISGKITEQEFKDAEEKLATFEKYSSLTKEQKEEIRKLGNRRNTLIKQYKLAQDNPTEAYWRLGGEQEARETASRARYRAGRLSKLDDDIKAQNEALKELKSAASKMTEEENEAFERFVALDRETDADKLPDNYSDVMTELGEKIPQNVREAYYDYQVATWVKDDEFNYVYGPGEVPQIHNNNSIVIFGDAVENASQQPQTFFQAAYHGTPSRFDRFDTGHIGEGEGAQVHGWGIYFAENREVAEGYRNRLTDNDYKVTFTGKPLKSKQKLIDAAITEIRWGLNEGLSVNEAIQKRIDFYRDQLQFFEDHPRQATKSKIKKAQDKMDFFATNRDKFKSERQGQVFKVEIPDNDVLLDEQKTFDDQPEKVKAGIQKLLDDYQNRYSYKKAGDEYVVYEGDREIDRYEDEEDAATAVRENNEALANQLENRGLSGDELKNSKGRAIYLRLSGVFLEFDETSKKLNEYGIKGITYDGAQDGRCYVVFDDKAIEILNQYYQRQQRQGDTIQGATEFEDSGRRIISIFESGNESTMAHELGHIFVADLKELAEMPNAPAQIVKDWETVKKWIGWKNGQKNFTTAQQEKFARGFEAYLRSGEAPATGLKKVFRDFKRWLTKIYKDFLSLGGKPSADVQAVMGRMLATEQEVENAFKVREAENFEKAGGFDYLAKDSQEMYQRWQNEAQEYAKEKVLAQAMKDLKAQRANEMAAVRDQMEQDIRAQLQQEPLYQAEALVTQNPKIVDMWPAEALGMTYDEYTQAIAEQGTLDKAVQTAVDAAMKEVEEGLPEEEIKQAAEAAVNSSEYRGMYLAFEQDFIEKKLRRDETLNNRIEKALADIEKTASGIGKEKQGASQTVQNLRQKINELKYQARWTAAENDLIRKIELAAKDLEIKNAEQKRREQLSELREEKNAQIEEAKQEGRERLVSLREEKNAQVDELRKAISDFRNLFKKTRQDVRVYRDTAVQKYKLIKQYAADNMAEMPISEATNVAKWAALEKRAGRESIEAMKRAIDAELKYQPDEKGLVTTEPTSDETLPAERKAKESPADLWRQANEAKLRQRVFAEYAAMAQKNKDYIRKKNARLQARSKTIAKNNNMPANERYMYNHGLYVLGLNKQDAPMPQEPKSIMEMIQGYKDNLQAFFVDEDGNISMPDYAISAMTGNTAYNGGYQNLTMEQYQYFNDMLTAIYKAGIDANKVKSMKDINGNTVLISDVAAAIVDETNARVPLIMTDDVTNAGTPTFAQSIQNKARRARVELTKPETILDMMGPTAYRYVYETVNQSWNKEQGMLEESAKVMQSIWAPYSNTEKSEMRSKKQYRFGTSILTKEEMICVAFNWGTEINRKRIMDGFGVDEMTVNELLSNLTQKDWQMVSSVWELVNSYWPETARVEESMTGIAPQKQTAMPFEITGKDGQVYKLQGGYYPIKYDPSKSLKAANQQQDDMAKQYAANNAAMNRNRGFTKQRVQGTVARPVLLSFNVLNRHISDVVHNICFRESLRDVNRIIKSPEVSQVLQDHFGIDQTRALEQWVRDCWAPDVAKKDVFASGMEFFRHKQTAAALGYRMTTAALNALNIYPMTDYLGAARTVDALQKFYSDPKANWDFALEHSIFLRQRAETMDRDAGEVLRKEFVGGYGAVADTLIRGEKALEKHAFDALAVTDLMLGCPLWTAEYQRVYQEMTAELKGNMDADAWFRVEMEAVAAGDRAVRRVFGSGEMKDLAPVQKGGEITKALTMFYSYFNVVFNALYSGYGEGRRQAMGTDSKILIAPLAQKIVFWIVLTGVTEGLMRTAIDALSGNGGDEPEDWMKAMFKGVNDNIAGTIPVFRDMWSRLIDRVMGERDYGSRALPAYTVFDNILKLSDTISNDKKSKIDVFREGAKITNGMTGIGNTVTDAIATTAYWADTDFDAPLYQYLAAVFFDKRLDRKKKK